MINTIVSCSFTSQELEAFKLLTADHIAAYKNWIASAVECGDAEYGYTGTSGIEYAKKLVPQLRFHEELFSKLNRCLFIKPS